MGDNSTYVKERCPYCNTLQFIWMGTWKTYTEAAECCSCGKFFLMGDKEESLYEIILAHCNVDWDKEDDPIMPMRNTLLNGGTVDDPHYGTMKNML